MIRLLERGALRRLDPGGIGVRELECHDTGLPARRDSLVDARAEGRRVDEPVRCVARGTGLPENELVDVKPVLRDLEECGACERRSGRRDQARAVLVKTLVVELDVVLYGESA